MLYCQHCGSRATIKHNTGCPTNTEPEPLTEEERTILAHYRGDCHNSADCRVCRSDREWHETVRDRDASIARLESPPRRDSVVGALNAYEWLVVRHVQGEHNNITVSTCALCEARNGVDGQPLTPQERKAVNHARGEHVTKSPGCIACVVRQQRDEAESRASQQQGTIRRQTATITALEAGVRDAQQRLNSIIEG